MQRSGVSALAVTDERQPEPDAAQPRGGSIAWPILTLISALMTLITGLMRGMGSAPSSAHDLNFQTVALLAAMGLLGMMVLALAAPRIRRTSGLITLAVIAGLILYDWCMTGF